MKLKKNNEIKMKLNKERERESGRELAGVFLLHCDCKMTWTWKRGIETATEFGSCPGWKESPQNLRLGL